MKEVQGCLATLFPVLENAAGLRQPASITMSLQREGLKMQCDFVEDYHMRKETV